MILKRKAGSATVMTEDGVSHPDIIIALLAPIEDKRNKTFELIFGYFHSLAAFQAGRKPLQIDNFGFRFTTEGRVAEKDSQGNVVRLMFPTYAQVKTQFTIDDNGDLVASGNTWKNWLLNQDFCVDFESKKLGANWEVYVA